LFFSTGERARITDDYNIKSPAAGDIIGALGTTGGAAQRDMVTTDSEQASCLDAIDIINRGICSSMQ